MKNKIYNYDFLIVGAGLIGALVGLALHQKKYKVLVVEKNNNAIIDKRTLAVNANSRDFLNSLGLWEGLSKEHLQKIIINDEIQETFLEFENSKEPMGSVIFNNDVLKKAREKLKKNKILIENLQLNIENFEVKNAIKINSKYYIFRKIILSIGKNYKLNNIIYKKEFYPSYKAYVGFFDHKKIHKNNAFEVFTSAGPLAVLPVPSKNKKTSTFIYTTKNPMTKFQLQSLIKKFFVKSHGKIQFQKSITSFVVRPHMSKSLNKNILLLGDSLRSIHPVAGQGWNLGVKDIQSLCTILDRYEINHESFSFIYESQRKIEGITYLSFTSLINFLYESEGILNKPLIKFVFKALKLINPIRELFIRQAMGRHKLI